jgi:hypothetical protein
MFGMAILESRIRSAGMIGLVCLIAVVSLGCKEQRVLQGSLVVSASGQILQVLGDETRLIVGSESPEVLALRREKVVQRIEIPEGVSALTLMDDEHVAVSGSRAGLYTVKISMQGQLITSGMVTIKKPEAAPTLWSALAIAYSPDPATVAFSGREGKLSMLSLPNGPHIDLDVHGSNVAHLKAIDVDGSRRFIGGTSDFSELGENEDESIFAISVEGKPIW